MPAAGATRGRPGAIPLAVQPQPPDPLQVVYRRLGDLHPGVVVIHPTHRYLVDPHPAPVRQGEKLGVEEPPVVLDPGDEVTSHARANSLEAALGIDHVIVEK